MRAYGNSKVMATFTLSVGLVFGLFSYPASAAPDAVVSGTVKTADGKALRGAVVTVSAAGKSVSRFTDQSGQYSIAGLKPGSYVVGVTAWGYELKRDTMSLNGKVETNFQLAQEWAPGRLSSAEWYAALPANEETSKLEATCMGCHNASELVRHRGSTADEWSSIVTSMGKDVLNENEDASPRKQALEWLPVLEKYFGPKSPAPTRQNVKEPEISDAVLRATFTEYNTAPASYVHSITVNPVTQQVYFVDIDRANNALGQLDIKTGQITERKFATDFSQPHNPIVAPDGKVWVALNNSHTVGMFDPETAKLSEFPVAAVGHTIDIDRKGIIWESGQGVQYYDPKTGKSQRYYLPKPNESDIAPGSSLDGMASFDPPAAGMATCGTYDLAVGLKDEIWYTCAPGMVGRLDPLTSKVKTFHIPNSGSFKGITVDPSGNVWFSSFSAHKLGRIDGKTGEITLYQPPTAHAGFYGLLIDRNNNDNLWLSDYEGSHITKFNIKTATFTEYPLPRVDGMPRFMGQDGDGKIWYTEWRSKIGVLDPGDPPSSHQQAKIIRASRQ
jgi:streptogramin lyase